MGNEARKTETGIMETSINTITDLMQAAGAALARRDSETLEGLIFQVEGWLQPAEETEAQVTMLRAMLEAAYLLDGEPSELV